jgi:hypothetical protein
VHLLDGSSTDWIPLKTPDGLGTDWLCPECDRNWEKIVTEHNLESLRPVCVDCVREIRCVFDRNYEGDHELYL